jgi:hypothetical protein
MPWILNNYHDETIDLSNPANFRDFSYPIFAQGDQQKEQCKKYYQTTTQIWNDPQCVPNYISNVGSTIYFLVRLEPFTDEEILFQSGTLDAADRTFQSLQISYDLMTSQGNRNSLEILPEFFFSAEIYENVNDINFPKSPTTNVCVGDVMMPPWASDARELTYRLRRAMESQIVSRSIHEWIDLIWGVRRRGDAALERLNVFPQTVYEFDPSGVGEDRVLQKAIWGQIHNCGQAAKPLFQCAHPKRTAFPIEIKGALIFKNTRKPLRQERLYFCFSESPDRWLPIQSEKSPFRFARLTKNGIEFKRSTNTPFLASFSSDIAVKAFAVLGTTLVMGHKMPLLTLWKIRDELRFTKPIHCHHSAVTTLRFCTKEWSLLAAGHADGRVSIFYMNSPRLIRILECKSRAPILMIRFFLSRGEIIVLQREAKSIISVFSVNGRFIKSIEIEKAIKDIALTSFDEGTKINLVLILTNDDYIHIFDEFDLAFITFVKVTVANPIMMSIQLGSSTLCISHSDGRISCWEIQ